MSRPNHRRRFSTMASRLESRRRAVRAAVGCAVESLEDRRLFSTLTINTTADDTASDGQLSLREAIALIQNTGDENAALGRTLDVGEAAQVDASTDAFGVNDTIVFDNSIAGGTISLGSAITASGTMVIDGGTDGMTLSGSNSRAFYVTSTADLTLNHLTITHFSDVGADGSSSAGGDGKGGAIYVDHGTLTLANSTLSNNSATGGRGDGAAGGMGLGGAIYIDHGSVTITGSTLDQNSVAGNQELNYNGPGGAAMGGAIYNTGGTLTVTDSTLSNNSAAGGQAYNLGNGGDADGGAVYVDSAGTFTVTDSTLSNNSATGGDGNGGVNGGEAGGGAVYVDSTGTLTVTGGTNLLGNTATVGDGVGSGRNAAGGAINNHGTFTLNITGGTIRQNAATGDTAQGGAIYSYGATATNLLTFTNSTLSDNSATTGGAAWTGQGGAVYVDHATLAVINSTLANNTAGDAGGSGGVGGALYTNFGYTTISFSTLSGNAAADGGRGLYDFADNTLQIDNSILGQSDNSVTDLESMATTTTGSNNLIRNTAVTGIGNLSSADPKLGPLQDNGGPTQTMRPAPDSPAIDAADDTLGGAPSTDQRGLARLAGAYDIGAAELAHVTLTISTTADTDTRDADLTLREAVEVANGTLSYADLTAGEQAWLSAPLGDVYTITFDGPIAGGTITLGSVLNVSGSITIDGGASGMTLTGGVSQATWRAFYVSNTGDLTLNKLTVTNFSDRGADGIIANGGDGRGGAIYVDQGTLAITNSTLANNSAVGGIGNIGNGGAGQGGAVYSNSGTVTITNSTLENNAATGGNGYNGNANAGQGGAVYSNSGTVTIAGSTLVSNSATGGDGFNGDAGSAQGGAVFMVTATLTITDSTLASNTAAGGQGSNGYGGSGQGGAVYSGSGDLTISNTTLGLNTASGASGSSGNGSGQGGAIYVLDGSSLLSFSTVSSNDAPEGGRGLFVSSGGAADVEIDNSILGQADDSVTDLVFSGTVSASGSNNLIRNTAVTGVGNLSSADPRLAAFGDYGGGVDTFALLPDSPALDAAGAAGGVTQDARGAARVYNSTADVGSFESQGYTLAVGSGSTPQSAIVGQAFGNALAVTLTENFDDAPIPGATVSFAVDSSGSQSATFSATATTNTSGIASVTATANAYIGSYTVTASVGDSGPQAESADFALTNTAVAPSITSANSATFTAGSAGSFTITTTGTPAAALAKSGTLPAGLTFTDNGDGTATLSGTPTAGGSFTLTITAHNAGSPDATQTLTLTVNQAPAFTSGNQLTMVAGTAGSFTITTTGFPAAAVTTNAPLPTGLTLTDNGDGTATLSGTPAASAAGAYLFYWSADNGVGSAVLQFFSLTVRLAPSITSADNATFSAGQAATFTVTTAGDPAAELNMSGTLPTGITFVDNGDGTGTLSGTLSDIGTYAFTIVADNGIGSAASQLFTLTVKQAPSITSANNVTFSAGQSGTFTVTTTGDPAAQLSVSGTLPNGLSFVDNGDGTGILSGTTVAGGTYAVTIVADNGVGQPATQSFTITVAGGRPIIVASGYAGGTIQVNNPDGTNRFTITNPFTKKVGVRLASADLNGDGVPDVIAGAGPGGRPQVVAYDGATGEQIAGLTAFAKSFTGGVFVATGDVDGDGTPDLIVSQGLGGASRVRVFSGTDQSLLADFKPLAGKAVVGARIAAADLDGDGHAEVVVGQGSGNGKSMVKVFDGLALTQRKAKTVATLSKAQLGFAGGVFVATGDVNGDGTPDVIVSQSEGQQPYVAVFNGKKLSGKNPKDALVSKFSVASDNGARIASYDVNDDGFDDIVTSLTVDGVSVVKLFSGADGSLLDTIVSDTSGRGFVA